VVVSRERQIEEVTVGIGGDEDDGGGGGVVVVGGGGGDSVVEI
jgi:hypothetical protein